MASKISFLVVMFFVLFISAGYAQPAITLPTIEDILEVIKTKGGSSGIWVHYTSQKQIEYTWDVISLEFKYLKEFAIYVVPTFLIVFILVYALLMEINIFSNNSHLMPALAFMITLVSVFSGVVGYVVLAVSNFVSLGVLALFLALIYLGIGYFYKEKMQSWGYYVPKGDLLYVFVTHLPLIITVVIIASVVIYVINGNIPYVGKYGAIIGAVAGFALLGLTKG